MNGISKRNVLKKQKLPNKITLKRSHLNEIATNEPATQNAKWAIKSEPRRSEEKRNTTCVRPTTPGTSFVAEWRKAVDDVSARLDDHLVNSANEIRCLKTDLQFTIEQLEKVKTSLRNEKIEKEKLLQEVSELKKANNDLIAKNQISTRRVEIAHDAFMKLKSRTIAYIADSYIDEEDANISQKAENVPV